MIAILRLKLRLYRRSVTGVAGWVGFVGSIALAIGSGVHLGLRLYDPPVHLTDPAGYVTTVLAVGASFWLTLAVLSVTSGEMLPPALLRTFPLGHRRRALGVLAASLIGAGTISTTIVVVSAVGGFADGPRDIGLIALAAIVYVVGGSTISMLVATAMRRLLQTRRGHDASSLLALASGLLVMWLYRRGTQFDANAEGGLTTTALDLTPIGAAGEAIAATGDGRQSIALLWLVAGIISVSVLAALYLVIEPHSLTMPARAVRHGWRTGRGGLLDFAPPWLGTRTRAGAVCIAEIRATARDSRRLVHYGLPLVLSFVVFATWHRSSGALTPNIIAWMPVIALQAAGSTQFAFDGKAAWQYVVAAGRPSADLLGKNLALVALVMPALLAAGVVAGVSGGHLERLATAAVAALGAIAAWLGPGSIVSVRLPFGIPSDPSRVPRGSRGGLALVSVPICMGISTVAPVLFALGSASAGAVVGALLALAYGGVVWLVCFTIAARTCDRRQPEIAARLAAH